MDKKYSSFSEIFERKLGKDVLRIVLKKKKNSFKT